MGKEWYWGGYSKSSNSRRGSEKDCTTNSNNTNNTTTTTTTTTTAAATATSGCMSAVFQFFDFHHFQFPLNPHHASSLKPTDNSFLPQDHSVLKGVEAPRNSLELEGPPFSSASTNLKETLNIPRAIQIKTIGGGPGETRSSSSKVDSSSSSSEISSSPGAKTPNLVARLMGLDLLPVNESQSPSYPSSSSSCHETPKSNRHHPFRPKQPQHGKLIISHRLSLDVDMTTTGTRSLPETPRISSARRSDVDHHHRLSLQINKENVNAGEEVEFSRFSYLRRKELKQDDEYRSPRQYARQIVKQVRESVSRKVGLDITNTLRNNRGAEQTRERDELVSQLKAKKSYSKVLNKVVDQSSPGKHSSSTPSCSPRLGRFLEPKQKITTSTTTSKENITPHQHHPRKSSREAQTDNVIQPQQPIKVLSSKSKLRPVQEQEKQHHIINEQRPAKKCKKATAGERFSTSRLKKPPQTTDIIRNKQEEPFVRTSAANRANCSDKKCKQTPLSNDLLSITVPTLLPVKKDPSPPATKLPQKQVLCAQNSRDSSQLSSHTCQTYKQETCVVQGNIKERFNIAATAATTTTTTNSTNTSTPVGEAEEYEYVTRILSRTGINKDTPVSLTKWFSPFHPLDPSIFQHLENMNHPVILSGHLSHLCNRKLMFGLVDEILVDILKPYIKMKPWVRSSVTVGRDYGHGHMQGSELIDTLCVQIRSYPRADCRVLEDIDGLIDKDLPPMKLQKRIAFEEEGEGVVTEVEKDILDTLILETAVEFGVGKYWR